MSPIVGRRLVNVLPAVPVHRSLGEGGCRKIIIRLGSPIAVLSSLIIPPRRCVNLAIATEPPFGPQFHAMILPHVPSQVLPLIKVNPCGDGIVIARALVVLPHTDPLFQRMTANTNFLRTIGIVNRIGMIDVIRIAIRVNRAKPGSTSGITRRTMITHVRNVELSIGPYRPNSRKPSVGPKLSKAMYSTLTGVVANRDPGECRRHTVDPRIPARTDREITAPVIIPGKIPVNRVITHIILTIIHAWDAIIPFRKDHGVVIDWNVACLY